MDYKADMHIHSKYSFDSTEEILNYIKKAEENNINYIALTDHIEFYNQSLSEVIERINKRNKEIDELQKDTNVTILKGLEISEPHLYYDNIKKLKNYIDIDVILGSIHHLDNMSLRKKKDDSTAINRYLNELLNMVTTSDIDVVAHIDYIKRFIDNPKFNKIILNEILAIIKSRNLALEVNTSGVRRNCGSFPSNEILDMYKSLGGNRITVGSDAHTLNEFNEGYDEILPNLDKYNFDTGIVKKRVFKKF